jgi:hypothetical protein
MRGIAAVVPLLLLSASASRAVASTDCLSVGIDEAEPLRCAAMQIRSELRQQPCLCHAANHTAAVLRVTLTDCLEGPSAGLPGPTAVLIERVIEAQVTEAQATKKLTGSDNRSWQDAVRDLQEGVLAWHRQQGGRR